MSTLGEKTHTTVEGSSLPASGPQSSATSQNQDLTKNELPLDQEKQQPPVKPAGPPGFSPPPNGGRQAWTQVLAAHLLFFNTFGILTTFGVYQTYYESTSSTFEQTQSNISWIGCIQAFIVQSSGIFVGPIYDKGYYRLLIGLGMFLIVFGHMMLSLATEFWHVILAQSFCIGIGMGCLFVPSISILPTYFTTRLGLAIGIASAGSSTGGVIYPIVMQRLIDSVGFPWAVRTVGFLALATLSVSFTLFRQRVKPPKSRAMIDPTAFKDVEFLWFAVATLIGFIGVTSHQIYFAYYASQQGITSTSFAFNLVSIYNGVAVFGRIIPNAISDKTGQFNILAPSTLLAGIVYITTITISTEAAMIGSVIVAGFFCGVLTALPPVCFAVLTKDKTKLGTRAGLGYLIISFGVLLSGPSAGAILQRRMPLDWAGLFALSATGMFVGGLLYLGLRFKRSGFKLLVKA